MKKRLLFLAAACMAFTACLKDGFNDFEALRHPLHLQGEINPTLGVPIGDATANINDLLNMFQTVGAYVDVDDNGIIAFVYDTEYQDTIYFENSKSKGHASKSVVYTTQQVVEGEAEIDLFSNIDLLDDSELSVEQVLVSISTYTISDSKPQTDSLLGTQGVSIFYDSITLSVVGEDNQVHEIISAGELPNLNLDSLIHGQSLDLIRDRNINGIINYRPKLIRYTARLNITFDESFFAGGITSDPSQLVADSLGINYIYIDADVHARFPLSLSLNKLNYNTDIAFASSFNMENLIVDSSVIYLECTNGIPLNLQLAGSLVDAGGNVLCRLFDPTPTILQASEVAFDATSGHYVSSTPTSTILAISVTREVYNALQNTTALRLEANLSTQETGNPANNNVAIRSTDQLAIRVYAKLKPTYHIDIPIGGKTMGNEKGGVE